MTGITIRHTDVVEARRVDFDAFGVSWAALIVSRDDGAADVLLSANESAYRLACQVPVSALGEDREDCLFLLSRAEVLNAMEDIALDEDLVDFDSDEFYEFSDAFVASADFENATVKVTVAGLRGTLRTWRDGKR